MSWSKKNRQSSRSSSKRLNEGIFQSLVGKVVKINRGGPNSNEGVLLSSYSDYVSLLVGEEVIYYPLKHIHSLTQNIKTTPSGGEKEGTNEIGCIRESSFIELLEALINQRVQINNGPESRTGYLLIANKSMIVLFTEEDGNVFFNMEHVKSIKAASSEENECSCEYEYDGALSFSGLFRGLNNKWVSINRAGPEAIEGVLVKGNNQFFTIINNEEAIRIHPFHIKSISLGAKGSFNAQQANQEEEYEGRRSEDSRRESYGDRDGFSEFHEDHFRENRTRTYDVYR